MVTTTSAAEPYAGGSARWRCMLTCELERRWQEAPHRQAALSAARRHYLTTHWVRP